MTRKFSIKRADRANGEVKVGEIVYDFMKCDYGLAVDDTRRSGLEYTSVTKDMTGGYPFFTIPKEDLEEMKEDDDA